MRINTIAKDKVDPQLLATRVRQLFLSEPTKWNYNNLATHFDISRPSVKAYLRNKRRIDEDFEPISITTYRQQIKIKQVKLLRRCSLTFLQIANCFHHGICEQYAHMLYNMKVKPQFIPIKENIKVFVSYPEKYTLRDNLNQNIFRDKLGYRFSSTQSEEVILKDVDDRTFFCDLDKLLPFLKIPEKTIYYEDR